MIAISRNMSCNHLPIPPPTRLTTNPLYTYVRTGDRPAGGSRERAARGGKVGPSRRSHVGAACGREPEGEGGGGCFFMEACYGRVTQHISTNIVCLGGEKLTIDTKWCTQFKALRFKALE